jgi:pimeloyl-ACP methyl ester carboxylesterase
MTWKTRQRSNIGSLAAITAGSGPLVLFIHGVGLRAEAWGAQIDALSPSCRVIAVDMPGHGHSAPLGTSPELADFTNAIASCLDEPAMVIGHSFGAMIALDMAIRHPEKVKGVAALNAIYRRDSKAQAAVASRAECLDGKTLADPTRTLERWFGSAVSPQREACHDWLCTVDPAGYRSAYRVFAKENGPQEQELKTISCPALFLTGQQEPNSTPAMSKSMAALVPDGRAEVLANAAHMMPMTHAEQVNAILADFVKALS